VRRSRRLWLAAAVTAVISLPRSAPGQDLLGDFTSPFPASPFSPSAEPSTTHTYSGLQASGGISKTSPPSAPQSADSTPPASGDTPATPGASPPSADQTSVLSGETRPLGDQAGPSEGDRQSDPDSGPRPH
jgi:hypothetical protein